MLPMSSVITECDKVSVITFRPFPQLETKGLDGAIGAKVEDSWEMFVRKPFYILP